MNYYKRHIGDYAKKAGHLSALEHGVYTLLLDAYYDRELAPTRAEAIRQARARSADEIAAVDAVLADFFKEVDGRFIQGRVEEEFIKAEAIANQNAAKGKLGGRPRKPKGKPGESQQLSDDKPSQSCEKPNPLIHQSTNLEDSQPSAGRQAPACPHAEIVALYHEVLPSLAGVKVWDETRQAMLRKRWREDPKRQSLDYWRRYFLHVSKSEFLMGRVAGQGGRSFACTLEWLIRPTNFAKVIEGKYHDR